jgi:hypothetical protein
MHEARMAAARADQFRPETKALLRARSKVERKIGRLQAAGMRKARFCGRGKIKLQLLIAAAVVNIKRLATLACRHRRRRARRGLRVAPATTRRFPSRPWATIQPMEAPVNAPARLLWLRDRVRSGYRPTLQNVALCRVIEFPVWPL